MPTDAQVSLNRDWVRAHQALLILAGCLAAGLISIAVSALRAEAPASWASVVAFGLATSGASIFVGGLIGFLFGIPAGCKNKTHQATRRGMQTAPHRG